MIKEIEIPEGYEARIEGNKVILEPKESEDEKIRKQLIGFFSGRYALCNINAKEAIAYLEKQKEQKPAEWSEEDEKLLNYAISMTDDEQVKRFLRSLRPQPHWKPSEEQMEILQYLCDHSSHPNPDVMPTLESLYHDLQKLL